MTIKQFLKELKQAKIKFVEPNSDSAVIRTCYGKCPIEALYRYKQHRSAAYGYAGELLGLDQEDVNLIASSADNRWGMYRPALAKACGVKA